MEIPAPPVVPPVVAEGFVVVATRSGQVLARRADDGGDAWVRDLAATAPLAAGDGLVIVPAEGTIHALALATGEPQWTAETPALTAPPLVGGGWVILAAGQRLTALSAAGGDEVWSADLAPVERRPAIHGDLLLVSLADGRIAGLDLVSGSLRWDRRVGANPTEPFPYGNRVYLGVDGIRFTCLRAADGSEDWTATIGAGLRGIAAADPERIYTASLDNLLRAFRRSTGSVEWKLDLGYRPLSGPILLGPVIAVPGRGATVRMFTPNGRPAAALTLPAPVVTGPGIATTSGTAGPDVTGFAIVTGEPGEPWRLSLTGPPLPAMPAPTPLSVLPGETLPPMSLPGR